MPREKSSVQICAWGPHPLSLTLYSPWSQVSACVFITLTPLCAWLSASKVCGRLTGSVLKGSWVLFVTHSCQFRLSLPYSYGSIWNLCLAGHQDCSSYVRRVHGPVAHWLMPSTHTDVWFCRGALWSPAVSALEKLGPDRNCFSGNFKAHEEMRSFIPTCLLKDWQLV